MSTSNALPERSMPSKEHSHKLEPPQPQDDEKYANQSPLHIDITFEESSYHNNNAGRQDLAVSVAKSSADTEHTNESPSIESSLKNEIEEKGQKITKGSEEKKQKMKEKVESVNDKPKHDMKKKRRRQLGKKCDQDEGIQSAKNICIDRSDLESELRSEIKQSPEDQEGKTLEEKYQKLKKICYFLLSMLLLTIALLVLK